MNVLRLVLVIVLRQGNVWIQGLYLNPLISLEISLITTGTQHSLKEF
jgi:hypothetical protein